MRKLFLSVSFLLALCFSTSAFSQSCRVDIISLKSKIKEDPNSVLYALGDALALRPDCIGDLVEAAIVSSDSKPNTISQIVKLTILEYPDQAANVAEAAVLASPENVDVIRQAFELAKLGVVDSRENPYVLDSSEREMKTYKSSKPYDPNDAANKALEEIDEILAEVQQFEKDQETTAKAIEEFKMVKMDEESITTLNDPLHHDRENEMLNIAEKELRIEDPVTLPVVKKDMKTTSVKATRKIERAVAKAEEKSVSSSVYPISGMGQDSGAVLKIPTILRSRSVSPTLPRSRK